MGFVVKLADSGSPTALNVLTASNRLAIEAASVTITVQLSAKERQVAEQSISLSILDQALRETQNQEKVLTTAKTDADGIVHFAVAGARFGTPGPAELTARFTGTRDMAAAFVTWPIVKACTVRLRTAVESSDAEVGDFGGHYGPRNFRVRHRGGGFSRVLPRPSRSSYAARQAGPCQLETLDISIQAWGHLNRFTLRGGFCSLDKRCSLHHDFAFEAGQRKATRSMVSQRLLDSHLVRVSLAPR